MSTSTEIDDRLQEMLKKVKQQGFDAPERTLFSLGGRGHFENPLSDLLAFFLEPTEVHNLGSVFLREMLQLAQSASAIDAFVEVSSEREYAIDGGRIDILVRGQQAALVIESKVNAGLQNNLTSYEEQVRKLVGNFPVTFVVFAPQQPSNLKNFPNWKWVSFDEYAKAVERTLVLPDEAGTQSKWRAFAKELLLHMRQLQGIELRMTIEQVTFVEQNLAEIKNARELESAYRIYILNELNAKLSELRDLHGATFRDEGWGFICDSPGKLTWRVLFQVPMQGDQGTRNSFYAAIWVKAGATFSDEFRTKAEVHHAGVPSGGKNGFWGREFKVSSNERDQAIQWLAKFAKDVLSESTGRN